MKDAIAFANAYVGAPLVSVEEDEDDQDEAGAIRAIPECMELARRFHLVFQDGIKPSLKNSMKKARFSI